MNWYRFAFNFCVGFFMTGAARLVMPTSDTALLAALFFLAGGVWAIADLILWTDKK